MGDLIFMWLRAAALWIPFLLLDTFTSQGLGVAAGPLGALGSARKEQNGQGFSLKPPLHFYVDITEVVQEAG